MGSQTVLRPKALILLDGIAATGASEWFPLIDYEDPTIHVDGIVAGDILKVQVSNDRGIHDAIAIIDQYGVDITADGVYPIVPGPRWARVNFTDDSGGGTLTVTV